MKIITYSFFLILFSLQSSFAYAGQYNSILSIGDNLPEFKNLPSISGDTISSNQLKEDILIFVSLANHCPWVKGMDEDLVALNSQFSNYSVRIIGLSMNHREDDRLPAMAMVYRLFLPFLCREDNGQFCVIVRFVSQVCINSRQNRML